MSLRFLFWIAVLVIGCLWTFRRPLVGVCLNIAFFPLNPATFGAGLETIRFQYIATICLALSYVIHYRSFERTKWPAQKGLILAVAWLLWGCLVATWAVYSQERALDACVHISKILVFTFLLSRIPSNEGDIRAVFWTIFVSFGLKAFLDRWGVAWGYGIQTDLLVGSLGASLVLFIPAMAFVVLSSKKWWQWIIGIGLAPFILDYFVVRSQRSAFASLAFSGVLVAVFAPKRIRRVTMLIVGCGALFFVFYLSNPKFWNQMATILDPRSEPSAHSRFVLNRASWAMVKDHPLGVGMNNYSGVVAPYVDRRSRASLGPTAHNTFLSVLGETGWPGLFLWLGAFGVTWIQLLKLSRAASGQRLVGLLVRGLTLGMLAILPSLWTHTADSADFLYWTIGLSIALSRLKETAETREIPETDAVVGTGMTTARVGAPS